MPRPLLDYLRNLRPDWRSGLVVLFAIVLLSRIPFLDAGYGVNVDAWRVARVAREIATTGNYSVSRFPGYPVQEIVCSWFWRGGPSAINGITALLSAVATVAFAASARHLGCRDWFLAGLGLAATPIFFVSSVCAKDYMWALAFVMLSLWCLLNGRIVLAGLFLGLATGCRLTSLAMVLPLAWLLRIHEQSSWRDILYFGLTTAGSGFVAFSPVWLRYGAHFFTFYHTHGRPDWATMFDSGTFEVWGTLGLLGVVLALGSLLWWWPRLQKSKGIMAASVLATIGIYTASYMRLPDQAGYLLPVVPAMLLGLCLLCRPIVLRIACGCLVLSPVIEISHGHFSSGAVFADRHERIQTMTNIRNYVMFAESLPGRNTFVVGSWEPQIEVMAPQVTHGRNCYAYLMSEHDVVETLKAGRTIYYSPIIREFNYRVAGIDLARYGAHDLRALYEQRVTGRVVP